MSIGSTGGIIGSAAGAPVSQSKGSEIERSQQDAASDQRQVQNDQKAQEAAGIGQTSEDQEASERDADGRRLWEVDQRRLQADNDQGGEAANRKSKDASGASGNALDLTG